MSCSLSEFARDGFAGTLLDNPKHRFRAVLNGPIASAQSHDVGQGFAGKGFVPSALRKGDFGQIAAGSPETKDAGGVGFDLCAQVRIFQPAARGFETAFLRPARKICREAGAGGGVRVLIDCQVDSASAGRADQAKRVDALAPVRLRDRFVMRNLRWQTGLLADCYGFPHRLYNPASLVADVGLVMTTEPANHLRKLDDFRGRRKLAGHVDQPRAQPECAVLLPLLDQGSHLVKLLGRGLPVDPAHDALTD